MKNYNFSFSEDFRQFSDSDIIYQVTGSKDIALKQMDSFTLEEVIESLTPSRKAMAKAVLELYHRYNARDIHSIKSSQDAYQYITPNMAGLNVEECWVIAMNQASRVIRHFRISVGGLTSTMVDARLIFSELLKLKAVSFILCHNHPSGNIKPSREDDRLTEAVHKAGEVLNIRLLDHVIWATDSFYSYADEGRL